MLIIPQTMRWFRVDIKSEREGGKKKAGLYFYSLLFRVVPDEIHFQIKTKKAFTFRNVWRNGMTKSTAGDVCVFLSIGRCYLTSSSYTEIQRLVFNF